MAFDIPGDATAAGPIQEKQAEPEGYARHVIFTQEIETQNAFYREREALERALSAQREDRQYRAAALEAAVRVATDPQASLKGDHNAVIRAARDFHAFLTEKPDA